MRKDKLCVLVFAESRNREDVYQARLPIQKRELEKLLSNLSGSFDIDTAHIPEIRSKRDGIRFARMVNASDCAAAVLYIPTFNNPATVAHTARMLTKPAALVGNHARDSLSQLGYLASGGALEQVAVPVKRIVHDGGSPAAADDLRSWVRAICALDLLRGQTYGSVGGRSLGISTGTNNAAQWERLFGVDTEHIDQLEIVSRANCIPEQRIGQCLAWIDQHYGQVLFSREGRFEASHLRRMAASYLAMKSIVEDYELDFCGIKCQTELSNGFCLQCLTVQLLNDPYDMDGLKEPVACSCEADADGALSMQILKNISGGQPTALQDIASITPDGFVLANCGAMASHFAALSPDPRENLSQVHLMPHGFGLAGGAATQFVCAAGEFTYMRMFRRGDQYCMGIFSGTTEQKPREVLKDYSPYRPTSFVHHKLDVNHFMETFCSNHLHCVRGNYVRELQEFCRLANIEYILY